MHNSKSTIIPLFVLSFLSTIFAGISMFTYIKDSAKAYSNKVLAAADSTSYDIIVVGAGTGGFSAAIQAARGGAKVLLLEETDWVGGQATAGGVPNMDGGVETWTKGIYEEFLTRLRAFYKDRPINTCYLSPTSVCFEPAVGRKLISDWLAEYSPMLTTKMRTKVDSLTFSPTNPNKITGVVATTYGLPSVTYTAKVVIDATELGSLLSMAPGVLTYRSGNTVSPSVDQSRCIQAITYVAPMKYYPNGVPAGLGMSTPPKGYNSTIERMFLELLPVYDANKNDISKQSMIKHNQYRATPDSAGNKYTYADPDKITKTMANWLNDLPYTAKDDITYSPDTPITAKYLEDADYRKHINCKAKMRTIQFLYFVQNVLKQTNWAVDDSTGYNISGYTLNESLCGPEMGEDEIPETGNQKNIEKYLSIIPYVRESRRVIGANFVYPSNRPSTNTLMGADIFRVPGVYKGTTAYASANFEQSSIAIGDHPTDLHGCKTQATLEPGESTNYITGPDKLGPFQIPMEVLIPARAEGFLVAEKNISQTRLVSAATREQPITMLTGQAAGALAALAVKNNVEPRRVSALDVQKVLVNGNPGVQLTPLLDTIGHLYEKDIQLTRIRKITNGDGWLTYSPNGTFSRDMMAIFITRAFDINYPEPLVNTFTDTPTDYWAFKYIESLAKSGITAGCAVNPPRFCPTTPVTNAQLAVFALRAWKGVTTQGQQFTPPIYSDNEFKTVPPHWAKGMIEGLAAEGIKYYTNQAANLFGPDTPTTRGKAAYVLNTILSKLGK